MEMAGSVFITISVPTAPLSPDPSGLQVLFLLLSLSLSPSLPLRNEKSSCVLSASGYRHDFFSVKWL